MKINFADPEILKKDIKFVENSLKSGWIGLGKYNTLLENSFKNLLKKKFAISLSNGTSAAKIIFDSLSNGLNEENEIIVPYICYVSPINMILNSNKKFKIIPVKIDPNSFQMDVNDTLRHITNKTKAILVVHNYGNTANIKKIKNFCNKKYKKILIIEDFSEAIFSKYYFTKYAGSFGDISFASFHATKTIACGEGGILLTNNRKYFNFALQASRHGMTLSKKEYSYEFPGFNFKLSNVLAALGYSQFLRKDKIMSKRRDITGIYKRYFINKKNCVTPKFRNDETPTMWSFPILFNTKNELDKVKKKLEKNGIITRESFKSITKINYITLDKMKNSNEMQELGERLLMIPKHTKLIVKKIAYIKKIFEKK